MNTLLQLFLFSVVVAVALCGAAPSAEDVALMDDTAQAVLKLHKLHKAGMVGEDVVESVCQSGATILSYCKQLGIPLVGDTCGAAQTLCSGYSTVKNLFHQIGSLFG